MSALTVPGPIPPAKGDEHGVVRTIEVQVPVVVTFRVVGTEVSPEGLRQFTDNVVQHSSLPECFHEALSGADLSREVHHPDGTDVPLVEFIGACAPSAPRIAKVAAFVPGPDHSADRFTDSDRAMARKRMDEAVEDWTRTSTSGRAPSFSDTTVVESLVRLGAAACGLGYHDLRESEVEWLAYTAREAVTR